MQVEEVLIKMMVQEHRFYCTPWECVVVVMDLHLYMRERMDCVVVAVDTLLVLADGCCVDY